MLHNRLLSKKLLLASAIAVLALAASLFSAQEQKAPQVIMGLQNPPPVRFTEDLPAGSMQAKATTACLECHEARIILQQRLSKAAWTKEVEKMVKWGAVVDPSDRDALIDYLSGNFSPDQPSYQTPRTSSERTPKKAAAKDSAAKKSE